MAAPARSPCRTKGTCSPWGSGPSERPSLRTSRKDRQAPPRPPEHSESGSDQNNFQLFCLKLQDGHRLMYPLQAMVASAQRFLIAEVHPSRADGRLQFVKVHVEVLKRGRVKFLQHQGIQRDIALHDVLGHHGEAPPAATPSPRYDSHTSSYISSRRTLIGVLALRAS